MSTMTESSAHEEARKLVELGLLKPGEASDALDIVGNGTAKDLISLLERRQILTPFQIQKLEAGETTGFYAGRYKLLYMIAGGTFARVFRAIEPHTGEVVAVKILRERHATEEAKVREFHREGRLTESLVHPNITRMLEVNTDTTTRQHYIAMEFIEGGNLREFIRIRKKLDPKELVRLGIQMVEGLRYALSKGVTHRDIKPTNILISASGDIKWVDFGLGGAVDGNSKQVSDVAKQEASYAALERATNAPKGDPRSDIFFLGLVFYELLTGEHPLGGRGKLQNKRLDGIVPLSRRDEFPSDLTAIIDKMLAYRPDARYQNYDQILSDLRKVNVLSEVVLDASVPPPPGLPRVVIIHHSTKVQEILKGKLSRRGFQVVVTTDIGRAATLCKLKPAECIIVDLDTTGQEGVDQYVTMKQNGAIKSAVFLVSNGQQKWLNSVQDDHIVQLGKPLILGPVYKSVRGLVEQLGHQGPSAN